MEQADKERIQLEIEEMAETRFPGAVDRVIVLQYGDEPVVEPGELMIRVLRQAPGVRRPGAPAAGLRGGESLGVR